MNQDNKKRKQAHNSVTEHRARINALFHQLRDKLERYLKARLGGSREEAKELVQDVYTSLMEPPQDEVENWEARLWCIARNVSANRIEHLNIHRAKAPLMDEGDEDHRTPENTCGEEQAEAAVLAAIVQLPERQRIVFTRYMEGCSFEQMSRELGVNERTCRRDFLRGIAGIQRITGLGRRI